MTKTEAIALKAGDKVKYRGSEAAFVRLLTSLRGALIDTGGARPHYIAVMLSELETV